jgi:NAD(P)-dependent dehydrogenase (short-subunit alcohol dehydrogenase family)
MQNLKAQQTLVIGGSSGIGLASASAFARAGAQVTIASRSAEKLEKAGLSIDHPVTRAVLDVTDDLAVAEFFSGGRQWDHVVITASQAPTGSARQLPLEDAYQAMHSKFWGAYRVARLVNIRPGGSLTLVSGRSLRPRPTGVLQGAINAALDALARGLSLELAPVRVNSVAPGTIDTPLWSSMPDEKRETMFASTASHVPVGRVGAAEDIAQAVIFLAANGFATGSTVLVDGGAQVA